MPAELTCPVCAAAILPSYRICPRCGINLDAAGPASTTEPAADPDRESLDALRGRILAIDAHMARLITQRQSLVEEYERHRLAIIGRLHPVAQPAAAGAAPAERREWSGARVRALLLWLGATLVAISALTFTAVAWSRLDDIGRALLLTGVTAVFTGLAFALRRPLRRLPMTAEAVAGLAVVLVLIDVYAARHAGAAPGMSWQVWWAIGTAVAAGYAAAFGVFLGRRATRFAVALLLPITAELLAGQFNTTEWVRATAFAALAAAIVFTLKRLAGRSHPETRVALGLHAAGSWLAAATLAGFTAAEAQSVAAAIGPAVAVASLAAAPELARRGPAGITLGVPLAALSHGVPAGIILTLLAPLVGADGTNGAAVVAGGATVLASLMLAGPRRAGTLVAGVLYALPGTLWTLSLGVPVVAGPLAWLQEPWSAKLSLIASDVCEGPRTGPPCGGSWAAVVALAAIAAVGAVLATRHRDLLGISTVAIGFAAALVPVTARASVLVTLVVTTAALVGILLASALADRRQSHGGWALLPGAAVAAVPTTGWAALTTGASIVTLALTTIAAGVAALVARSSVARAVYAALAALLAVTFAGVAAAAAGADEAAAGFTVAIAAGAALLAGVHLLRGEPATGTAVETVAALAAFTGVMYAASSTPWLAGALTVLVPVAAIAALRPDRRDPYRIAAAVLALGAVWAWLAAAKIDILEAYTAPAAVLALAAGIVGWRHGPGRSWLTLGPALLLAIGPTLAPGISDDDVVRLIVAALLSLATVVAGAVWRLQAPLCIGAAALLALAVDQWGDDIVRLPRWLTIGAVGLLLMWVGATFEHRRRDWHRASDVIRHFG